MSDKVIDCAHCDGRGKCSCDECVKKAGVKTSIWGNPSVSCCKCDGKGKRRV